MVTHRRAGMSLLMLFFWTLVIVGGLVAVFTLISYVPAGGTNFIGT